MEQGIEIINKPNKGDVLVWDGKGYKNISFNYLLSSLNKNINELEKRLLECEKTIKEQAKEIRYLKGE